MFIQEVIRTLQSARVRFGVAGGYAVALHGATRGTVDIDLVIRLERKQFISAEKALLKIGLVSRLPVAAEQVFDFREEYIENRNLVAWCFYHPKDPSKLVDILITHDLRNLKTTRIHAGDISIPVIEINDLISMKQEAGRTQDHEDIKALEKLK